MPVKIKWSESAVEDYTSVINYLKKKWPATLAERFINIVESRVDQLHYFPFIGTASQKSPDIRSIIITKHNKLYYRVKEGEIEILSIFDTRQDPEKNIYE